MLQEITTLVYKYFFVRLLRFPENAPHPWDYYAHFILSFILVGVFFGIFWVILALFSSKLPSFPTVKVAFGVACVITLAGGFIKEVYDWRVGRRDFTGDFLADVLGVGLFILVALVVFVVIKMIN